MAQTVHDQNLGGIILVIGDDHPDRHLKVVENQAPIQVGMGVLTNREGNPSLGGEIETPRTPVQDGGGVLGQVPSPDHQAWLIRENDLGQLDVMLGEVYLTGEPRCQSFEG